MCNANQISEGYMKGSMGGTSKDRWLRSLLIPGAEFQAVIEGSRIVSGKETNPAKADRIQKDKARSEGRLR